MPLPDAPEFTVIQALLLTAVQLQPAPAVTAIVSVTPPATTLAAVGAIEELHGTPACVTVKVLPPIVSVPFRAVVAALAATVYETEPLPLPVAPAVMVIHVALLEAVHAQPAAAVTVTEPVPAADVTVADAEEIVGTHGAPACVTVNVLPAIVSVPVRDMEPVFAATL